MTHCHHLSKVGEEVIDVVLKYFYLGSNNTVFYANPTKNETVTRKATIKILLPDISSHFLGSVVNYECVLNFASFFVLLF